MPRRVPERCSLCIYGVKNFMYICLLSLKKFGFPDNKCLLFKTLKVTLAIFDGNILKCILPFSNFLNNEGRIFFCFVFDDPGSALRTPVLARTKVKWIFQRLLCRTIKCLSWKNKNFKPSSWSPFIDQENELEPPAGSDSQLSVFPIIPRLLSISSSSALSPPE